VNQERTLNAERVDVSETMKPTIDAYLDGLLEDTQAAVLTQEVGESVVLATRRFQNQIDSALERLFVPPSTDRLMDQLPDRQTQRRVAKPTVFSIFSMKRLSLAAAIGICILGVWRFSGILRPAASNDSYQQQPWRSMDAIYRDAVATGFKPAWMCKDDDEFASYFRRSTGSRLLLAEAPTNIHTYGLSVCNCITPHTLYLLARVENSEVLVFADRAANDAGGWKPATPGFHLFERRIGSAVLYELTQLDSPHILDLFRLDDGRVTNPPVGEPSRWQKDAQESTKPKP